jgi:salicylate hydroxylase
MSTAAGLPVIVAGAGIGGLAVAIALARRGVPVHVLEAEAEFGEVGAGLQIGPHGGRVVASWGLADQLRMISVRPDYIAIKDGLTGKRLTTMPLGGEIERRHGAPYQTVERRRLHQMLLSAARDYSEVTITPSAKVTRLDADRSPVKVETAEGQVYKGCAVICADGARSRLREALFGGAPAPSGKVAWRATAVPSALADFPDRSAVNLWMAPDTHLVLYMCGPDGPLNIVAVVDETALGASVPTPDIPELLRRYSHWAPEVRDILRHFNGWLKWSLWGRPPLGNGSKGAATVLGDAAHPILPFLASGAVLALEDAETFAIEFARTPDDPVAALQRYEARRMPRADRVVAASARQGQIYHMDGAMRFARNATLMALPESYLLARHEWLYGFRVTE